MKEIGREERIYGTRENTIKERKERTIRETRIWAEAQHNEWQKTELDHMNDRESAWRDYMTTLSKGIKIKNTDDTQSIIKVIRACRKECYKQNSARKRCRMRHDQMEKKKIRQNMVSTGKYGTIVRSIKAQPRSPIPATATKQLTEIGI